MATGKKARWMVEGKFLEALREYAKFEETPARTPVVINRRTLSGGLGLVPRCRLILCDEAAKCLLSKKEQDSAVIIGKPMQQKIRQKLRNRGTAQ